MRSSIKTIGSVAFRATTRQPSRGMAGVASRVFLHEVSPRDGLQQEKKVLSTNEKLALIHNLCNSGLDSIEVTSFVRADIVPALADSDELCQQLFKQEWAQQAKGRGVSFAGLVLNQKGFERFIKSGLDQATLVVSCTDTHSRKNSGRGFDDALKAACDMIALCKQEGFKSRAYASMAWGCPFEGKTDPAMVLAAVTAMHESGADTIIIADTLGSGSPSEVKSLLESIVPIVSPSKLGLHMHDTRDLARANCEEGLALGLAHFDAAVGGCGGCPFAPGAKGNLDTFDLLTILDSKQHRTDSAKLKVALDTLEKALGRQLRRSSA